MEIVLSKETALIWETVSVSLKGFKPRSELTLTAEMGDPLGRIFRSSASFTADDTGSVDLSSDAPLTGTYSGVDSLGMFWSMELVKEPEQLLPNADDPLYMRFEAEQGGARVSKTLTRLLTAPGVTVTKVSDYGLVAEYYRPLGTEKLSNIIVFGGSDGGINSGRFLARFFSGHGFGALALAYFGLPGLADDLVRIPLEIIEHAISYIKGRPDAAPGKIGISGISRGGELSLLAGSVLHDINAVAALTPSSILWESEDVYNKAPSFTYRGLDYPYVECDFTALYDDIENHRPFAAAPVYAEAMKKKAECEAAMIGVENIQGPLLMVSGKDDEVWPAYEMCLLAEERLKAHGFKYPWKHVTSPLVGHRVFTPGFMPTNISSSASPTLNLIMGGRPKENAYAQEKTRKELIDFFKNTAHF